MALSTHLPALALAGFLAALPAAAEPVDLELVLMVDVSGSIGDDEHALQKKGHADAFRSPDLHRAIRGGLLGRIAVTYVEWDTGQIQVVGWRRLAGPEDARAFADAIEQSPRHVGAATTAVAAAIASAAQLFRGNGFEGLRTVIDISGDGADNAGGNPLDERDRALASGVTAINGIVIPNEAGVEDFYLRNVIGGGGAFMVVVADFASYKDAILDKLVREIAGAETPRVGRLPVRIGMQAQAQARAG